VPHELVNNSAFLLARLGMAVKARATAAVSKAGYDIYDYSVLAILAEEAREAQATIAATLDIDPGRLVALLDSLEDRGLVVRRRDPRDRRRHLVSITEEGEKELTRLRTVARQVEDDFFAPLDPASRKQLQAYLLRLAAGHDTRCVNAERT
jgi:DNA-binding MarR family transcriptional regulator